MAHTLVVLTDAAADAATLEARLSGDDRAPTVHTVSSLCDCFDALCYDEVDCVVVSGGFDETDAWRVEQGLRALYPDLPIVLAGATAPEGELDADATTVVGASDIGADAVVTAVRDAVGTESAAGRPPSRLETLAMSLFDELPMHFYAKDDAGRHALGTGATVDVADAIGRTDLGLTDGPLDHHRKAFRHDRHVVETGETLPDIEEYTGGDVDEFAVTTRVPWYDGDGNVTGLVGITRDITDRKQREKELRRRNERLAKVALVAAHRLRNELQIASGRLNPHVDDVPELTAVRASHGRLASIVDDIVDMATQERTTTEREEVWLSTIAREVWATYEAPAAELQVQRDGQVSANPESLRIFFEIILSNALDHGGDDVTVTVRETASGFVVEDDGPGIDADPPDQVFDVGFSASEHDDGFGLYVAQRVATDHSWELHAENSADGGARFAVRGVESAGRGESTDS